MTASHTVTATHGHSVGFRLYSTACSRPPGIAEAVQPEGEFQGVVQGLAAALCGTAVHTAVV